MTTLTDSLWTPRRRVPLHLAAEAVIARCVALGQFTEVPGEITRRFLSPPMHDVQRVLGDWMRALGMEVSIDAIGNLHGLKPGGSRKRLVIGSHLDTVPNAGAYDGILGVVLGIGLLEACEEALGYDVEVVGFSEEEGVRFGLPFLGSHAFTGAFPKEWLERTDVDGVTIGQVIRDFGLDPERIAEAKFDSSAAAYLEFHIEQGPVLESLGMQVAAVEGIAGQSRFNIRFTGQANHAGTTPMDLRKDALTGAAQWISTVEREARATHGLLATVGRVSVTPGAANVIPGTVEASLDVRHLEDEVRLAAVRDILSAGERIATSRGLKFAATPLLDQPAVPCNKKLTAALIESLQAAGYPAHIMPSGAGHDAMIIAPHIPMTMLFLRSPGGISHHPDESVRAADVVAALETGLHFLKNWNH